MAARQIERTDSRRFHPFGRRGWTARLGFLIVGAAVFAGCHEPRQMPVTPPPVAEKPAALPPPPVPRPAVKPIPPPVLKKQAIVQAIHLGDSVRGEPLILYVIGSGPTVLIFGGIHGNESGSAEVAMALIDYLSLNPDLCRDRSVAVITSANPDGLADGTRTNAHRVDLNRNFPAGNWKRIQNASYTAGASPASEPETKAIMAAVNRLQPQLIVALHCALPGHQCNNYDGPAVSIARLMSSANGYPVKASMGYPTPGSFGTWAGIERRIPTITLEMPGAFSGEQCWDQNRQALLLAIKQVRSDRKSPIMAQ